MENLDPPSPPPNQGWENGAFLPFARLHPCLGGGGMGFAVPFYFVQDCRGIWYTAIKTWLGVFVVIFFKTLYNKNNYWIRFL